MTSDADQRAAAERVIANPIRTEQDRKTDAARKPIDFILFAGVRPGMRVLDVSAGGGYTSQLLALVHPSVISAPRCRRATETGGSVGAT